MKRIKRISDDGLGFDQFAPLHHDALMRTTIDLPDSLHRIALSFARHSGSSLSHAVAELMRRGLGQPSQWPAEGRGAANFARDPLSGLPLVRSERTITADDVGSADDV
jgi:hypothetical protein